MRMRWVVGLGLVLLVALAGCQPAARYSYTPRKADPEPGPTVPPPPPPPEPIDPKLVWNLPRWGPGNPAPADVPLVFVTEAGDAARWAGLPGFWNPSPLADPRGVVGLLGSPLTAAASLAVTGPTRVEIKVPRGLGDPKPGFPAKNEPTLGAWQLGRKLFFDPSILVEKGLLACATCHDPAYGFASRQPLDRNQAFHAPSLLNVAYRPKLFWDGRADTIEACVQCLPEGERGGSPGGLHSWPGAVNRLRYSTPYMLQFRQVFGADPTQDNVARALATYLRTLLAGNSLHDRALAGAAADGKAEPDVEHFAALLGKAELADLNRTDRKPLEVAQDLHRGYLLFHDKVEPVPTACARCHGGPLFTDHGFHNLSLDDYNDPVHLPGRFGALPPGLRTADSIGAYRTPSLRDVARTGPYFHTGGAATLDVAVHHHLKPRLSTFLDPAFLNRDGDKLERDLVDADREALLLYLRALNSQPLPGVLLLPPR